MSATDRASRVGRAPADKRDFGPGREPVGTGTGTGRTAAMAQPAGPGGEFNPATHDESVAAVPSPR
ncbi:hypothetical protein [Streptomyces sp. Amel2xB2]|uniref:hypothetical protein n=1 Tax=Streptomyces sp. Amel2xB2 TaxID=1305829 RepID=UPI0011B948EB|nr:hypothetical protein [Streptomyces sp. Amel2xB2]